MSPSTDRVIVSLTLAAYIALSVMVAPEHVHESDADHPRSAVHRHLQVHVVESHDRDHAQLAQDEEHVVWLDSVALHQPVYHVSASAAPAAEPFEPTPLVSDWVAGRHYNAARAHGPPRSCLSLRAPPCLSA